MESGLGVVVTTTPIAVPPRFLVATRTSPDPRSPREVASLLVQALQTGHADEADVSAARYRFDYFWDGERAIASSVAPAGLRPQPRSRLYRVAR